MPKRIASLFSGCGGLDLGFTGGFNFGSHSYPRLDTQIVFANDFDRDAFTCYNANQMLTADGAQCLLADIPYESLTTRFKNIADDPKRYHAPKFFRRFAYGEINGTITASAQPDKCGVTHPVENRRYSVRECARIQSFPDNYTFGSIPLQSRYKVIGNAVPPVLGWVVASALLSYLPE